MARIAKPKDSEYVLSDGQGLQLRELKSWRFVYKHPQHQKQSRVTLGTYPDLSIANARKIAKEHRELVAQGIAPYARKAKRRHSNPSEHPVQRKQRIV